VAKKPPAPDPGEAMWVRVKATVRPIRASAKKPPVLTPMPPRAQSAGQTSRLLDVPTSARTADAAMLALLTGRGMTASQPPASKLHTRKPPPPVGAAPIDKSWERTLRSGRLTPDMTIDLHGHYLSGAHSALSRALDRAAASEARIILVIAGKSRGPDEAPRGAIRRELATWLAHSHHAPRILAVRNAHPRHGGEGALYVVLRKRS
jgi:DNA-nicking Smr family endonuclease